MERSVFSGLVLALLAAFTWTPAGAQSSAAQAAATRVTVKAPPGFRESCARYPWLCRTEAAAEAPLDSTQLLDLAERINSRVNRTITQLSDPENYGVAEYWTLPTNGQGDCEDLVLEKYKELIDAGVDAHDLSVAIVLDPSGNNHAVLVLHHPTGDLVLDSLTSRILPWNRSGYRFLAMQAADDKSAWEIVANAPRDGNRLAMR